MARCRLRNWVAFQRRGHHDGLMHEYLMGEIYGHPNRPDGTVVTTSPVVRREGAVAVTASGTRYELEGEVTGADACPQNRAPA